MYGFFRRYRIILSCGFFLFLSLSLATVNRQVPYQVDPVGVLLLEVMHPLQLGVAAVSQGVGQAWDRYVALWSLRQTNEELQQRLDALEAFARRSVELELANQRLKRLLALRDELGDTAIAARVVGRSPMAWVHTVVLDKGEQHGVMRGMAVLTPNGVVGKVVAASTHTARILLVSDPNSGVDGLVQRTRVQGIVAGTIDSRCVLQYIQHGEDVRVGDVVMTSGLDGIFPKGQQIGVIVRVSQKGSGMFQDVEVRPSAELAKLEEVLVVAPRFAHAGE